MNRIMYIMPGQGVPEQEIERRTAIANSFVSNRENKVIVTDTDEGPTSIESSVEGDACVMGVLKKLISRRDEYDSVIVGCADDPGLFSIREILDIPVIGPLEVSLAFSRMLGERFGYVTVSEDAFPETRMLLRKYGEEGRCASIRSMDVAVGDLIHKRLSEEVFLDRFVHEVDEAVREGATTILLGCMSMAFMLLDEKVKDRVGVPVINPAKVAVKTAEVLMALGLAHSRLAYPKPDFNKLRQTILPGL